MNFRKKIKIILFVVVLGLSGSFMPAGKTEAYGVISVSTQEAPKLKKEILLAREEVKQNMRTYEEKTLLHIYDSCFDRYGNRIFGCHLTLKANFVLSGGFNVYLLDTDTGDKISGGNVEIGKRYKLVIENPEGEWSFQGGTLDTPPIEWVDDAEGDYQKYIIPVDIENLHEYEYKQYNGSSMYLYKPKMGVVATEPEKMKNLSFISEYGKFEISKEGDSYYAFAREAGVDNLSVYIPEIPAYATINNLWFNNGKLNATKAKFGLNVIDSKKPIAKASISTDGINYSNSAVVEKGVIVPNIYLSAQGSYDPDEEIDSSKGIFNGGVCEWFDNEGISVPGSRVKSPSSIEACDKMIAVNKSYLSDEKYTLRITDTVGAFSTADVFITPKERRTMICAGAVGATNICQAGQGPFEAPENALILNVNDQRDLKFCKNLEVCSDPLGLEILNWQVDDSNLSSKANIDSDKRITASQKTGLGAVYVSGKEVLGEIWRNLYLKIEDAPEEYECINAVCVSNDPDTCGQPISNICAKGGIPQLDDSNCSGGCGEKTCPPCSTPPNEGNWKEVMP